MNTWKFIIERFPLKVTFPLVAVLCSAPLSLIPFNGLDGAILFVTIFLSLLSLRIADDLASIDRDRMTHPSRGLPSARINAIKLKRSLAVLVAIVVSINYFKDIIEGTLLLVSYYSLYFLLFKKMPLLIKPFLSNAIFCCIPLYTAYLLTHQLTLPHLLLGLFSYFSVIAHEFAHSVHGTNEAASKVKTYAMLLGSRRSATLSFLVFAVACIFGIAFWHYSGRPLFFLIALLTTTSQVTYLEIKLIREPLCRMARPFYIYGFTFFLIPYLGLVFDHTFAISAWP